MISKTTKRFDHPFYNRDTILQWLSGEMAPFFIGPISPQVFLDSFLPTDPHQKYKGGRCAFGDYIRIFVSERSEHQCCGDISMSV